MSKKDLIMGVDPGLSGAIALLNPVENKLVYCDQFPLKPVRYDRKGKMQLDLDCLQKVVAEHAHRVTFAVFEKVGAMPGQGVVSMFRFGQSYGQVHGLVSAFAIQTNFVSPTVWKPQLGLGRNKQESLDMAKEQWPEQAHLFKRKKDDGRAEAALLAWFGVRMLGRAF